MKKNVRGVFPSPEGHWVGDGDGLFLVLSGEPIAEPIVGYGPFVMNSRQEIETAMNDFRSGKFGRMPPQVLASMSNVAARVAAGA